jgi:hypothetical protein
MSQLEVDKVLPQSGTTLTLGESGDTITIPSGATFSATLTAPVIDEINDNNGNEEIIFTTTASAVNELTIANAATGTSPTISATGSDTNIGINLTPKGTGGIVLGAGAVGTPALTTSGDLNTGIFFSAADTIDFAEGGVATGQFDSSGNFKFNSGYGSVATAYGCRAWVNFNGSGTVSIRGSGNVTSITDNGTGDYTVNFTNNLTDTNYVVTTCVNSDTNSATGDHRFILYIKGTGSAYDMNTNNVGVECARVELNGQQRTDSAMMGIAIFR